ncbi:MAG: hypothetical protein K9N48_04895 [Verrucomicrobia bacterium]|nr:hypothetical protein [Verrucomicrobiota bacterium]
MIKFGYLILAAGIMLSVPPCVFAQMVTGSRIPGFEKVFSLNESPGDMKLEQLKSTPPANVVWPGDAPEFVFKLSNNSGEKIEADARWEVIRYGTKSKPGNIWEPDMFKIADVWSTPTPVAVGAGESVELTVCPELPECFGGFVLVLDLGERGRIFGAPFAKVPRPEAGRVQFPAFALDMPWPHEISAQTYKLFQRLGIKGCRYGVGYFPTTSSDFEERWARLKEELELMQEHGITVMITIGEGGAPMPLGRPRPWLTEDGTMIENVKQDYAWLPEYDEDLQRFCKKLAMEFGWPKGPVNAVELWNEPWEGVSISGWGADCLRYREMYEHMAKGIVEGREEADTEVLVGGACSSANTRDKLFPDGSDKFLKWLDFVSIHYQPLAADPALEPEWMNREAPYGPVRVWDTESWIANSEDRVAAVIASMRSMGQSRTAGIYKGNVYRMRWNTGMNRDRWSVVHTWAPAVAVAVTQKFIGQRPFERLLFTNGLPWVFQFKGVDDEDDGSLVVLGDLGAVYDRELTLFRDVCGLENLSEIKRIEAQLADAMPGERAALQKRLETARILKGASMVVSDPNDEFVLFDFYGNPVSHAGGEIEVPLNGLGYFLRARGGDGSFSRLVQAVRGAEITGYEPISFGVKDFTRPVNERPVLKVNMVNVLNRPIGGSIEVKISGVSLDEPTRKLKFAPHEKKLVEFKVENGKPSAANIYPLAIKFDAGVDGRALHEESMRVNYIVNENIVVDGRLDDWSNAIPQPVTGQGIQANLTEKAWRPFMDFDSASTDNAAVGYLAYDGDYFYFAAKVADDSSFGGGPRYETRADDSYFYPKQVYSKPSDGHELLTWPEGVRRFTYRRNFEIPSGNSTDNIQIAFNAVPPEKERRYMCPPGTMPRYMVYPDTDYEFAFNRVAEEFGGGTEVWRLLAPGIPRKHFFPRQPESPIDGGPVKDGKLIMRRRQGTRFVEAAIPWSELSDVKKLIDAGETVKFSFRVNNNRGPALELASGRSVSKVNSFAFHNDWTTHWANELEFGFER